MPPANTGLKGAARVGVQLAHLRAEVDALLRAEPDELLLDEDRVDAALAPHLATPSSGPEGPDDNSPTAALGLPLAKAAEYAHHVKRQNDEVAKLRRREAGVAASNDATSADASFPPCSIDAAPSEAFRVYEKRLDVVEKAMPRWKRDRVAPAERCREELARTEKRRAGFSRQRGPDAREGQSYISEGNRAFNKRLEAGAKRAGL